MALRRDPSRLKTVGIAIAAPALRRAVINALAASGQYKVFRFETQDIDAGTWPRRRFAAIVATPKAFRARRRHGGRGRIPVILVVSEAQISREKALPGKAHAFVLANRLDSLPSIVVLSRDRLSILPRAGDWPEGPPSPRAGASKKK